MEIVMSRQTLLAFVLTLSLLAPVAGQNPKQPDNQTKEDVVRVTTNLVQVDVAVTDQDGKQVTDLNPQEFEVIEDGRKQAITNFSYISTDINASSQPSNTAQPPSKNAPKVQPASLRPEQVRRTAALVVDDLGLSLESLGYVREALRKFVDEQMQPNDLVAIILTSAGSGSLQQFTSDKRKLYAAIERVNWHPNGRGGESPFPVRNESQTASDFKMPEQVINEFEDEREANYAVGTFGTLGFVVRGMMDLPGRKSLVLISEAFRLFTVQGRNQRLIEAMQRLTDQANQASTVIYTVDASGLQTLTLTASDKVAGMRYTFDPQVLANGLAASQPPRTTARVDQSLSAQAQRDSIDAFGKLNALADARSVENIESQTVLSFLAQRTGGIAVRNRNDLGQGLQQIMNDQKGYYLIGYRPEESTIDPSTGRRRFHHLEVKVKRSGLRVRSRNGFYGVTDEERRVRGLTRDEQLATALVSPFASDGVRLRLTSLFGNDQEKGSFMRSLLQVEANDLTFEDEPDGSRKAVLDVVAVNYGESGRVVNQLAQTQAVSISKDAYERVLKDGLMYVLDVPIKQAGAYQMRIAVRDTASGRIGAAGQYVEVPDLKKNLLTLSGIILNGTTQSKGNAATGADKTTDNSDQQAGPAVRRLGQGMILNYGYTIYNVQLDGAGHPQLQTQMRLFRDGKGVFTGRVLPFSVGQQTDMKRLSAGGRILIGPDLSPGQYVLQVAVTDALAKDKFNVATQWIDFEIVK
jgi:VWFA-related protein